MNPEKAEKLFNLMKQFGVEYVKTDKLEIKMASEVKSESKQVSQQPVVSNIPIQTQKAKKAQKVPQPQAAPPVEDKIPHHVNEVSSLLKLNDMDLVDKLFPEGPLPPTMEVIGA